MRTSYIFILLATLVCFGCGVAEPVQTSSSGSDSLFAATFNDTTTLHFRVSGTDEVELTWDASEGKNYNTPTRYQHKGRLVIPAKVEHDGKMYAVTAIGKNALFQQRSITELYILDGVRTIDERAITGCDKLKKLQLPATLDSIGASAFSRCKLLTEVSFPEGVRAIGKYAFNDCKSLKEIAIPQSISVLPEGMFEGCYSLKKVKMHEGISLIESRVFNRCETLVSIELPHSVSDMGTVVFSECHALKNVRLPKNLEYIPEGCFHDCIALETIDLSGIKSISHHSFANCQAMQEIKLPETLTAIGNGAFSGCINIKEVRIPISVTFIANNAFAHCMALKDIYLLRTKPIEIESEHALPSSPCRINIPKGSIDSYQFTAKWKKFDYREVLIGK